MQKEYNKPNIVARMQEHSMAFSYCVENNDLAGALLKIQQLNMDLPVNDRIIVGHGIDKATLPNSNNPEDLKNAKLIDAECQDCKKSNLQVDMHIPFQALSGQERLHLRDAHFEWLTKFAVLVESRISEVGYKRGWWSE